jgi:alanyl aminopeptidase
MKRLPVLLLPLLALAALAPVAHADDYRLPRDVVPTQQSIRLTVDPRGKAYEGSVTIALHVAKPVTTFRLHAEDIEIARLTLKKGDATIAATFAPAKLSTIAITAASALQPGDYTLAIDFAQEFDTRSVGLYRMEKEKRAYAFTQFEAIDARKAFPCFDEPGFKIPYQITVRVPAIDDAISNTPVASSSVEGDWKEVVFARTKPLPSYLLALAVGEFDYASVPGTSIPTRIVATKGSGDLTAAAVRETPKLLAALERWFAQPYPYEKLDLIAVPEYWPGAMEHPGAITFAEPILLQQPNASAAQRRALNQVVAHELAHMWYGDLVTMAWWDDFWLNESFADWMASKVMAEVHPELGQELADQRSAQGVMTQDARPAIQPIRVPHPDPADMLGSVGIAYAKGKAVLGMFERYFGPDEFRAGVLRYIKANAWKNASEDDLWAALGKGLPEAMKTFVEQSGMPLLKVSAQPDGRVTISQSRFLPAGVNGEARLWRVPVVLRYANASGTHTKSLLLTKESATIELGKGVQWVLPDADARGYYRWWLPGPALAELGVHPENLTVRERVAFLGNLSALVDADLAHADALLRTAGAFLKDTDPGVIEASLDAIEHVAGTVIVDRNDPRYLAYLRQNIRPVLQRIGYEKQPGENDPVSQLRPVLLGWLVDAGDAETLAWAAKTGRAYLADPTTVDPAVAGVALNAMAMTGDAALFETFRKNFEAARTQSERNRYLGALAAFEDPALQQQALDYSLTGPLRPNELLTVASSLGNSPEGRDRAYAWFTTHYDEIARRLPPLFLPRLTFFARGCEPERVAAARKFFADPGHNVEATAGALEKVSEQVNDCAALRLREGENVERFLAQ